jgi:hypothetical protein
VVDFPSSGRVIAPGDAASRRSLIAGTVGVAALMVSGCSAENPTSADKAPKSVAKLAPDVAVATRALAEIRAVRAAVSRTISKHPPSRPKLAPLVRMHEAHEETLIEAVPERARTAANPAPYVVPRKRAIALRKLEAREQRLHDQLDGLALRAESGDFARLLASMGAGITQRLVVWPS